MTTQSQLSVNPLLAAEATEQYLQNQTGPLTNPARNRVGKSCSLPRLKRTIGIQTTKICLGFEKLPQSLRSQLSSETLHDLAQFPADWPELELLSLAAATVATNDSDNYASFAIAVLATTSRGNVTINSTDTSLNPLISPNWLLTKTDQDVAVQGLKRARQIAAASGITVKPEFAPGPTIETDAEILNYIQQSLGPIHHASATCEHCFKLPEMGTGGVSLNNRTGAMGKAGDADAVVDSKGKVFGVNGLRIVDISVFPLLPPGHTQANVCKWTPNLRSTAKSSANLNALREDMLAEKLTDDIRNGR